MDNITTWWYIDMNILNQNIFRNSKSIKAQCGVPEVDLTALLADPALCTATIQCISTWIAWSSSDPVTCAEVLKCLQSSPAVINEVLNIVNTALLTQPNPLLSNLCAYINKCIDQNLLVVSTDAGNLISTWTDGWALLVKADICPIVDECITDNWLPVWVDLFTLNWEQIQTGDVSTLEITSAGNTLDVLTNWVVTDTANIINTNDISNAWLVVSSSVNGLSDSTDLEPAVQALITSNTDSLVSSNTWHIIATHTAVDNTVVAIQETVTSLLTPTLVWNVLTLSFSNENGITQSVSKDLSGLTPTNDIHISGATYNASLNTITIAETNWGTFSINLSEFSILTNTLPNGDIEVIQEWVTKFVVPKDISNLTCSGNTVSATNKILTTDNLTTNTTIPSDIEKTFAKTTKVLNWCTEEDYYETCPCGWYFWVAMPYNFYWSNSFDLWFGDNSTWWNKYWDTVSSWLWFQYQSDTNNIIDPNWAIVWNWTFKDFINIVIASVPPALWLSLVDYTVNEVTHNSYIIFKVKHAAVLNRFNWYFWESEIVFTYDCCEPSIPSDQFTTQADWNETDPYSPNYVANKPTIPTIINYSALWDAAGSVATPITVNTPIEVNPDVTVRKVKTDGSKIYVPADRLPVRRTLTPTSIVTANPLVPTTVNIWWQDFYSQKFIYTDTSPVWSNFIYDIELTAYWYIDLPNASGNIYSAFVWDYRVYANESTDNFTDDTTKYVYFSVSSSGRWWNTPWGASLNLEHRVDFRIPTGKQLINIWWGIWFLQTQAVITYLPA